LLVATVIAHAFTVLTLRRSILTEKVSRRGYHLRREYATDPLEILFVREVMRTNSVVLPADSPLSDVLQSIRNNGDQRGQRLYPVVDNADRLVGVVTRSTLHELLHTHQSADQRQLAEVIEAHPVVAYPDEPLRVVVYRMAETGLTRLPVVARDDLGKLLGMLSLQDLLQARVRNLDAEQRRERLLPRRLVLPRRLRRRPSPSRRSKPLSRSFVAGLLCEATWPWSHRREVPIVSCHSGA
jgi:CIC family chloride channel protein